MKKTLVDEHDAFQAVVSAHYDQLTLGKRIDHNTEFQEGSWLHDDDSRSRSQSRGRSRSNSRRGRSRSNSGTGKTDSGPARDRSGSHGSRKSRSLSKPKSLRSSPLQRAADAWATARSRSTSIESAGRASITGRSRSGSRETPISADFPGPAWKELKLTPDGDVVRPCGKCTYENFRWARHCEMCGFVFPVMASPDLEPIREPRTRQRIRLSQMNEGFKEKWLERNCGGRTLKSGVHIQMWKKTSSKKNVNGVVTTVTTELTEVSVAQAMDPRGSDSETGAGNITGAWYLEKRTGSRSKSRSGTASPALSLFNSLRKYSSGSDSEGKPAPPGPGPILSALRRYSCSRSSDDEHSEQKSTPATAEVVSPSPEKKKSTKGKRKGVDRSPSLVTGDWDVPALAIEIQNCLKTFFSRDEA